MKSTVSTICGIFLLFAMGVSVSSSASSGSYSGCAAMLGTKDPEKLRKICGSKAENSKKDIPDPEKVREFRHRQYFTKVSPELDSGQPDKTTTEALANLARLVDTSEGAFEDMTATTGEALKSCLVWALGRRDPPKDKLMDKLRTLGDQHDRQRARLKALEDGYGAGITQIFRRLSNQSQKLRLKLQSLRQSRSEAYREALVKLRGRYTTLQSTLARIKNSTSTGKKGEEEREKVISRTKRAILKQEDPPASKKHILRLQPLSNYHAPAKQIQPLESNPKKTGQETLLENSSCNKFQDFPSLAQTFVIDHCIRLSWDLRRCRELIDIDSNLMAFRLKQEIDKGISKNGY